MPNLDRYKIAQAQKDTYENALKEIRSAQKSGHWMWYIFPQIKGLGRSYKSSYYAIKTKKEAFAYLDDDWLGYNLQEITHALLTLNESNPVKIFGCTDSMKLKSCMTLFSYILNDETSIYQIVLDKFFKGEKDNNTIEILNCLAE